MNHSNNAELNELKQLQIRDLVVKPEKINLDASTSEWAAGLLRAYCTLTKQLERLLMLNSKAFISKQHCR